MQPGGIQPRKQVSEILQEAGTPMHQDDVARSQPAGVAELEPMTGVPGAPQHGRIHATGADGLIGELVLAPFRRAGEERPATKRGSDEVGSLAELSPLLVERQPAELGMMHRVVLDGSAKRLDLSIEIGVTLGDGCDQKRGDRGVARLEEGEHVGQGMPTIVDRDKDDRIGGRDLADAGRDRGSWRERRGCGHGRAGGGAGVGRTGSRHDPSGVCAAPARRPPGDTSASNEHAQRYRYDCPDRPSLARPPSTTLQARHGRGLYLCRRVALVVRTC
jgi:hypothetical protein